MLEMITALSVITIMGATFIIGFPMALEPFTR